MARSFLYMPPELSKLITHNVQIRDKDIRLETPMAQGTHIRAYGNNVVRKVVFNLYTPRNKVVSMTDFFALARNRTFWALFPIPKDPRINPKLYYMFYMSKVDEFMEETIQGEKYGTQVEWDWHYLVPPREYGDASLTLQKNGAYR